MIQIKGTGPLRKELLEGATLKAVKTIVKYHGANLQQKAMQNAQRGVSFQKGYSKGATKQSIASGLTIDADGLGATVEAGTNYAAYVEFGTRFMEAEPFMRPAHEEVKQAFINDLRRLGK